MQHFMFSRQDASECLKRSARMFMLMLAVFQVIQLSSMVTKRKG